MVKWQNPLYNRSIRQGIFGLAKLLEVVVLNRSSKKLLTGVLLLLVLMTLPGVALAGSQDFTLINRSPFRIVGFWVAPANSDNWEENILEGTSVAPNSSIEITFDNTNNVQWWNFRIKDSSGKTWNWEKKDYDLTQISQITYYYQQNGKGAINYK